MDKNRLIIILIALITLFISSSGSAEKNEKKKIPLNKPNGVAVILTGAAARIPQEAALLQELDRRGLLKNVVFISGVSSGALNAVMLNGILSKKMTWGQYRRILFNLKNKDIFTQDKKKIPVNTQPARDLYARVAEKKLGFHQIGDLPIMTEISFTHLRALSLIKDVYRMCSRKINAESDTTLNLVDIMMASSAFPMAFPSVRIKNAKTIPDVEYVDGGVGDDQLPYHSLLEFEKFRGAEVERVYIVSRKSDSIPEISDELKNLGIDDRGIFNKLGISFDVIMSKGTYRKLEAFADDAPELVPRTYVWIPEFNGNFLMFSFDNLKKQYMTTYKWARKHNPVPLTDFLAQRSGRKKTGFGLTKQ
jgi:hypothetical protein